jgi:hypothetical protein
MDLLRAQLTLLTCQLRVCAMRGCVCVCVSVASHGLEQLVLLSRSIVARSSLQDLCLHWHGTQNTHPAKLVYPSLAWACLQEVLALQLASNAGARRELGMMCLLSILSAVLVFGTPDRRAGRVLARGLVLLLVVGHGMLWLLLVQQGNDVKGFDLAAFLQAFWRRLELVNQ